MKKSFITIISLLFALNICGETKEASINIDSRIKFQHVTGFGGFSPSPTWEYWLNDTNMDKLFGKGDHQLGLNILRLYLANNKNGWGASIANAKRAKQHGAFIFASPWSPPAEWKSNKSEVKGGSLLEEHYEDWANLLNSYYEYMKEQGAPIDAVSLQNEPDWSPDYQSCVWTGAQFVKFLRLYGNRIGCKIIAPESVHFTRSIHDPILNDPEACEELDILGGHFYGWDGSAYPLATQKGKEVWMTEYLINERQQNEGKDINWKDDGFLFARSINDAMLANFSAWVHYSLKRFYGCLGDGQYGTTNNEITKRGYILSHYAKYVSGTTRVRHSLTDDSGKLSSSAYLTDSGDSIVVMIINPSADTYNTQITLPFFTLGGNKIKTNETRSMIKTTVKVDEETYTPNVSIEPYSVNTFIFKKSAARTDIDDGSDAGEAVMTDNYDLYGAGTIPAGWRSKSDAGIRHAGTYSLGPRIMSFSPEGMMTYGFYFRTGTADVGYVTYGEETGYRLTLEPGNYTLSYSIVGWKALPTVTASVQRVGDKEVARLAAAPTAFVSTSGSGSRITQTTDKQFSFEVTEKGDYVLKWQVPRASANFTEALLGNVRLVLNDPTGIVTPVQLEGNNSNEVYDIFGCKHVSPSAPGIYIKNGKKVIKR